MIDTCAAWNRSQQIKDESDALLDIDINVVHIAELCLVDLCRGLQTLSIEQ